MPAYAQRVDQAVVDIMAFGIGLADAFGKDPRPGDGEPVGLDAQIPHQPHVVLVAMIMIVGDIGLVAIPDLAGRMGVSVPDRSAAAVFFHGAFDLERGGGNAPNEAVRESGGACLHGLRPISRWRLGEAGQRRRGHAERGAPGGPADVASCEILGQLLIQVHLRPKTTARDRQLPSRKRPTSSKRFRSRLPTRRKSPPVGPAGFQLVSLGQRCRAEITVHPRVISRSAGVTWRGGFPPMSCRAGYRASILNESFWPSLSEPMPARLRRR